MPDGLSDLPDEIRLHILTFLPSTKLQASTSVLSRRWRNLWTSVPSLSFRLHDFSPLPWVDPVHTKFYPLTVDRCLSLSTAPSVDRLSLDAPPSRDPALDRCLFFASSRSVRHLSLRFFSRAFHPPLSLFRCRSLSSLTLEGCTLNPPPDHFQGFPSLKSLSLIRVELSFSTLQALLSQSPILETLVLQDCRAFTELVVSAARNPCLLNLAFFDSSCSLPVRLDTPHIQSIFYRGHPKLLHMERLPQLRRACILGGGDIEEESIITDCKKMVSAISDAKVLVVNNWFSKVLMVSDDNGRIHGQSAMFAGLKELCFRVTPVGTVSLAFDYVLELCPSLEKLCVEFEDTYEDQPPPVAPVVCKVFEHKSHPLKIIRLFNISDLSELVYNQLSLLLDKAVALETLSIHPFPGTNAEQFIKLKKSISRLRMASPRANIVVPEHSSSFCDKNSCYMKLWENEVKF